MIPACNLSPEVLNSIKELETLCNHTLIYEEDADDIFFILSYDSERLISVLSYIEFENCFEVSGITHPDYRNRGFFKALFEKAHFTKNVMYTLAEDMDTSRHTFCKTEYLLKLTSDTHTPFEFVCKDYSMDISQLPEGNLYTLMYDNTKIGHVNTFVEDTLINIYDVYIEEKFRGQGLCRVLLEMVYTHISDSLPVVLHVTSENVPACRTYFNMGFVPITQIDYYTR